MTGTPQEKFPLTRFTRQNLRRSSITPRSDMAKDTAPVINPEMEDFIRWFIMEMKAIQDIVTPYMLRDRRSEHWESFIPTLGFERLALVGETGDIVQTWDLMTSDNSVHEATYDPETQSLFFISACFMENTGFAGGETSKVFMIKYLDLTHAGTGQDGKGPLSSPYPGPRVVPITENTRSNFWWFSSALVVEYKTDSEGGKILKKHVLEISAKDTPGIEGFLNEASLTFQYVPELYYHGAPVMSPVQGSVVREPGFYITSVFGKSHKNIVSKKGQKASIKTVTDYKDLLEKVLEGVGNFSAENLSLSQND